MNSAVFVAALGLLSGAEVLAAESAVLELSLVDASTGRAVPARVRIRDRSGIDHVPAEKLGAMLAAEDLDFQCQPCIPNVVFPIAREVTYNLGQRGAKTLTFD